MLHVRAPGAMHSRRTVSSPLTPDGEMGRCVCRQVYGPHRVGGLWEDGHGRSGTTAAGQAGKTVGRWRWAVDRFVQPWVVARRLERSG
jgi:hypothetical protein